MTAPDLDALERAAQAADWTVNAASYAASWAFEKLATPAAVRAIIARLREAERDRLRAALEEIARKDMRPYIQIGDDPNECGATVMNEGWYAKIARAALNTSEDN